MTIICAYCKEELVLDCDNYYSCDNPDCVYLEKNAEPYGRFLTKEDYEDELGDQLCDEAREEIK